jgi:DNA polymerase-3 subunit epsilon
LEDAHSAEVDATATWEILEAQLEKYPQMGNSVESIVKFTGEDQIIDFARRFVFENGVEVFNFGKHKGKTIKQVLKEEPGYYGWMLDADFPLYTKQCLRNEMEKIKSENQQVKENDFHEKLSQLKNKFGSK